MLKSESNRFRKTDSTCLNTALLYKSHPLDTFDKRTFRQTGSVRVWKTQLPFALQKVHFPIAGCASERRVNIGWLQNGAFSNSSCTSGRTFIRQFQCRPTAGGSDLWRVTASLSATRQGSHLGHIYIYQHYEPNLKRLLGTVLLYVRILRWNRANDNHSVFVRRGRRPLLASVQ